MKKESDEGTRTPHRSFVARGRAGDAGEVEQRAKEAVVRAMTGLLSKTCASPEQRGRARCVVVGGLRRVGGGVGGGTRGGRPPERDRDRGRAAHARGAVEQHGVAARAQRARAPGRSAAPASLGAAELASGSRNPRHSTPGGRAGASSTSETTAVTPRFARSSARGDARGPGQHAVGARCALPEVEPPYSAHRSGCGRRAAAPSPPPSARGRRRVDRVDDDDRRRRVVVAPLLRLGLRDHHRGLGLVRSQRGGRARLALRLLDPVRVCDQSSDAASGGAVDGRGRGRRGRRRGGGRGGRRGGRSAGAGAGAAAAAAACGRRRGAAAGAARPSRRRLLALRRAFAASPISKSPAARAPRPEPRRRSSRPARRHRRRCPDRRRRTASRRSRRALSRLCA